MLEEILKNLKEYKENKAYTDGENSVTYGTLYKYIINMYNFILENQNTKTPIIIYGHKSIYMISCMLACSFAGIAYVPIDISMPIERLKKIIEEVTPSIILCTEEINIDSYKIINKSEIDSICSKDILQSREIELLMKEKDIYYIIFTSGSTRKTQRSKNYIYKFKFFYKLV